MPKRKNIEQEDGEGEAIRLVIVDQENNRIYFKVRPDTTMKTVFRSYGDKRRQNHQAFNFFHGEKPITRKQNSTPAMLGIEDGDVISVMEYKMGA